MNPQFKKGVLNLCVLSLLERKDMYGYELVQAISTQIEISEGAVYPLLRRLTNDGLFTTYLKESTEGPPRKYYQITEQGRNELQNIKIEWENFITGVNFLIQGGHNND